MQLALKVIVSRFVVGALGFEVLANVASGAIIGQSIDSFEKELYIGLYHLQL